MGVATVNPHSICNKNNVDEITKATSINENVDEIKRRINVNGGSSGSDWATVLSYFLYFSQRTRLHPIKFL